MPEWALSMLESVKRSINRSHPSWDKEKVNSYAYAIVQSQAKKHGKPLPFNGKD